MRTSVKGRCDYLLIPEHNSLEHYVELKGSDVEYAVEQIEQTIKQISALPGQKCKYCFIISTCVPLTTSTIQKLKLMFKRKYNAQLIIKANQYEHDLDS